MSDDLITAAERLASAQRVACFTGAGVSAESGLATFRDAQTGHWSKFDPTQLASQAGFAADPGLVWRWYMERLGRVEQAQPNAGHRSLVDLAGRVPAFTVITQNVDDLHERAGSDSVLHLHGTIFRCRCNRCRAPHTLQPSERTAEAPPACGICGGLVRPDVVWFGEPLPEEEVSRAWHEAEQCDLMLVVGTSGLVYPAAELPFIAARHGAAVIEINPEPTPISSLADVMLLGHSGEIVPRLLDALEHLE